MPLGSSPYDGATLPGRASGSSLLCTRVVAPEYTGEQREPELHNIPEDVNGKTKSRSAPILAEFTSMLRQWMLTSPLKAPNGSRWPFAEQLLGPDCCLFPGHKISKGRELHRTWTQPITTRAFLYKIGEAAAILQRERANRHEEGFPSIWDDVDLSKLGTHNIKRTCVSLLKDQCRSGLRCQQFAAQQQQPLTGCTTPPQFVGREQPSRLRWVLRWGLLNLRLHSAASV